MRLGQSVCEFVTLPSDEEIRLAIVPLTEAEFLQVISLVAEINVREDLAGAQLKDRRQSQEILVRAIREPLDLSVRVYNDVDDMMEDLDVLDVDELIDRYNEMMANSSPQIDGLASEEFEQLKKVVQEMDWNALNGRAWYAARRFLTAITPQLLSASALGSFSTRSSTTKTDSEKSTPIA